MISGSMHQVKNYKEQSPHNLTLVIVGLLGLSMFLVGRYGLINLGLFSVTMLKTISSSRS